MFDVWFCRTQSIQVSSGRTSTILVGAEAQITLAMAELYFCTVSLELYSSPSCPKTKSKYTVSLQKWRLIGSRLVFWTLGPWCSAFRHSVTIMKLRTFRILQFASWLIAKELISASGFISHLLLSVCEVWLVVLPESAYR